MGKETDTQSREDPDLDPWNVPELKDSGLPWNELDTKGKVLRVTFSWILKPIILIGLLYLFVCSLSFLSSAFQLLGGKEAGKALSNNDVVSNPIAGLMIGVLATVLLQSSSTTTSILVSMVSAGILEVELAIPMVMGANIGTSVTNTIVSLGHMKDKNEFRRAFAGATVHDMFNFLSVVILLPLELASHYLYHLSKAIIDSLNLTKGKKQDLLKVITKPFTSKLVQLDKNVIIDIAKSIDVEGVSLLKKCETGEYGFYFTERNITRGGNEILATLTVTSHKYLPVNETQIPFNETYLIREINETNFLSGISWVDPKWLVYEKVAIKAKCGYLFEDTSLSDAGVGGILLVIALILLCICLFSIVKLLHSLLKGRMAFVIKKGINADFPKPFGFLTGYIAILLGAGMTILVQSSSIFTSALTPLVGLGVVTLERTYPLTLGANIGTTVTGLLAALASSGDFSNALQLAFCHLFFNITGILIWYPVPHLRKLPLFLARGLGNTTAKYKWFALFYLIIVFFLLPGCFLGLSLAGWYVLLGVAGPFVILFIAIIVINVLQRKKPEWIHPDKFRTWNFLPVWMHSLGPMDHILSASYKWTKKCCPSRNSAANEEVIEMENEMTKIDDGDAIEPSKDVGNGVVSEAV
eukprot:m.174047 g.174047  ORF g.174047 m.174047 type:complete len:640 (+) comp39100_c0_seq23:691-2610(+)